MNCCICTVRLAAHKTQCHLAETFIQSDLHLTDVPGVKDLAQGPKLDIDHGIQSLVSHTKVSDTH